MRRSLLAILLLLACFSVWGQHRISAFARQELAQMRPDSMTRVFVTLDTESIPQGMKVLTRMGDLALVSASASQIKRISAAGVFRQVDAPHRVYVDTDSSRSATHAAMVNDGVSLMRGYGGAGVVLGVIDTGIDFNHLAFRDSTGARRIERVYMPTMRGGHEVVIDGDTLPGSQYVSADEIKALTTDDATQDHGTHTLGIAGGTVIDTYGGMAPDARLVAVAIPNDQLSEDLLVLGARYIADYAKQLRLPCVISISMGGHEGPHDGSSWIARAFDEISTDSTVIVLSAGNEGNRAGYLHKQFDPAQGEAGTRLATIMRTSSTNGNAEVDAWCRNSSLISLNISLLDTREDEIKFRFDEVRNDTVLSINEPDLATGNIRVAAGIDPINGKFRIYVNFNTTISKTAYKWVLEYLCQSEADLDVWACDSRCDFQRMGLFGYEMGSSVYSINDMATGRNTISVGSFAARTANGIAWGNIAPSSSYGSLPDGRSLPLVAAPGVGVISSVSGYKDNTPVFVAYDDDAMQHRWAIKSGTSMSAPCVAGIIALWKQACPSLTPQQIQEILTESSTNDVFTASNPVRWGSGKIDALQGILRAFAMMRNQCDVNCDGVVDVADANLVIDVILGLRYDEKTDVTGDGITDVADINRVVNVILNRLRP